MWIPGNHGVPQNGTSADCSNSPQQVSELVATPADALWVASELPSGPDVTSPFLHALGIIPVMSRIYYFAMFVAVTGTVFVLLIALQKVFHSMGAA